MTIAPLNRRRFLSAIGAVGGFAATSLAAPLVARGTGSRPVFTSGVQSGDVDASSGVIWTKVDRPARIAIDYSTRESFSSPVRLGTVDVGPETDFTVKTLLTNLPADQTIFYRFIATNINDVNAVSAAVTGQLRTAPVEKRAVRFGWSGDTAGQGWGIDDEGMRTYATIAAHRPDFFIHSGDSIYADNPMPEEITLRGGGVWKNRIVTDAKREVARTLDEFRGQWAYNLLDNHVRHFNALCPVFYQWDDHEVLNNWSPSTELDHDPRYLGLSVSELAARSARAFHEMTPIRHVAAEPGRVFRKLSYGPLLDVFFVDLRSYRGPNTSGLDRTASARSQIFGARQLAWLKRELARSTATWKVIASDLPVGLVIFDDYGKQLGSESIANGDDGAPLGREMEFAELLRFVAEAGIGNIVWLTADVHYTAAHHYDPSRATFKDFLPFWEFVSGPLHSGTYGQQPLDKTFGPQVRFVKAAPGGAEQNLPPSAGLQFFGLVDIDPASEQMTVRLMDRNDNPLYAVTLDPMVIG